MKQVAYYTKRIIKDERGSVMHMMRRDDPEFVEFGEIYFSTINPKTVKAWHLHKKMTLNYACVHGKVLIVAYDLRVPSVPTTYKVILEPSEDGYCLISIPPGIWNGIKNLSDDVSIIANCSTHPHHPNEIIRRPPNEFEAVTTWGHYEVGG